MKRTLRAQKAPAPREGRISLVASLVVALALLGAPASAQSPPPQSEGGTDTLQEETEQKTPSVDREDATGAGDTHRTGAGTDAGDGGAAGEEASTDAGGGGGEADDAAEELTVRVRARHHGGSEGAGAELSGLPVVLQAARPRGPFEPKPPEPVLEREALTGPDGIAVFDDLPGGLTSGDLRLRADVLHGGTAFSTPAVLPADGVTLDAMIYEKAHDASHIRIEGLKIIVEVAEDFLIFTQIWSLGSSDAKIVDTSVLPGEEFEKGLPLEMPHGAKGISVFGPGEQKTIDGVVYWSGTLRPDTPTQIQIRFSISQKDPDTIVEQPIDYPARDLMVAAPIQTGREKVPRLDDLALTAPGFELGAGRDAPGLRPDRDYLYGTRERMEAGSKLRFRLEGLPFERPLVPWFVVALAALGAALIVWLGRRERDRMEASSTTVEIISQLERERDALLDELADLEEDYLDGYVDEREYESESLLLREQIALILKKLRDLRRSL